ncbi:MAG: hypothetical protein AAFP13_02100 [Pseudomonadota bacterium]
MTVAGGIFVFVAVVTLSVTGFIATIMIRNPRGALPKLDHREDALPQVMAGRYLSYFTLALLAVAYRDFAVMAGLQAAYIVASLADVVIYWRRKQPVGPHVWAAFASLVALLLCAYVVVAEGARPLG